jgi:hypothetical protein
LLLAGRRAGQRETQRHEVMACACEHFHQIE